MIKVFQWSADFETGIDDVDSQHKRIVEIINAVGPFLADEEMAAAVQRDGLLDALMTYAVDHFAEEEALMLEMGLDPDFVAEHAREHHQFSVEVRAMREHIDAGHPKSLAVLRFLTNWLTSHILGVDQLMAAQMRHIRQGCSATEALKRASENRSDPSRPLLDALGALYQMVSLRNRELRRANEMLEAKVAERTAELSEYADRLKESEARLRELSVTDPLTGLPNRRRLDEVLQAEFQRVVRSGDAVAIVSTDLDHFKDVNDAHGHDVGDEVLRAFAALLGAGVREIDLVARTGGEEFVIVMPGASAREAFAAAERLRRAIQTIRVASFPGSLTASFGVAAFRHGDSVHSLLKRADEALYAAKRGGRDRVVIMNE